MNGVMIIPTGIGCEIGGHAGDATPAARLLASVCDTLVVHPNVVNASSLNEMTENMLYVEGSMLDRFLEGKIELQRVRSNKILVVVNKPVCDKTVNSVSAARASMGVDAEMLILNTPLEIIGAFDANGCATGTIKGWEELVEQVGHYNFDALAIVSKVQVPREVIDYYWENGGVNPWGGAEAVASKLIANALNKPVAHAPFEIEDEELSNFVCDPRGAAELVSWTFLHCILKGLHRAPRIGKGLSVKDIDVMVSPYGCWWRPHQACRKAGIPIIIVKENKTVLGCPNLLSGDDLIFAENYLEAAGYIAAMKAGVLPEAVRRPLKATHIRGEKIDA